MRNVYRIASDHHAVSSHRDLAEMLADTDRCTGWTEMTSFPLTSTYVGVAAIGTGVFQVLQRDWEDLRVETERLIDSGDSVVAVGRHAATHRHSGKLFEARVARVRTVEDGRTHRSEQFCDTSLVGQVTR